MSRRKAKIFRKSINEETVIYNSHAKSTVKGNFIVSTTPEKIGVRVMILEPFLPDSSRALLQSFPNNSANVYIYTLQFGVSCKCSRAKNFYTEYLLLSQLFHFSRRWEWI